MELETKKWTGKHNPACPGQETPSSGVCATKTYIQRCLFRNRKKSRQRKFTRNRGCRKKAAALTSFVRMSVCWSPDSLYWMITTLRSTSSRTFVRYRTLICFVRLPLIGFFAVAIAPWLPSNKSMPLAQVVVAVCGLRHDHVRDLTR